MKKILGILLGFLLFVGGPAIADNQVILMGLGGPDWSNVAITGGNVGADTYGDDASLTNAELKTLDDCETTELFVGGGAGSAPVCTTATGSDAPARATSPTFVTPVLGDASATSLSITPTSAPSVSFTDSDGDNNDVSGKIYNNLTTTTGGAEVADLYFQAMGAQGTAGTLQTAFWWNGSAESLILPLSNDALTPTLAFGDDGTGFYQVAAEQLNVAIGGALRITITDINMQAGTSSYWSLRRVIATATTPNLLPNGSDNNTGIGAHAADALSLIAGEVEAQRLTEASRTIESNASVCQDNSGVELKTVAAHGLAIDDVVQVAAGTGALCGGLSASTNYYVLAVGSTTTATLSASRGGSIVAYSTTGTAFTSYNLEIIVNVYGNTDIGGGNIRNVTTVNAATYDLLVTDFILNVTYTDTGTVAIDLKTAQAVEGRIIHIKDADFNAGANNITITTEGAEKIDEQDTYVISANGNAVSFYSDGSHWFIY